MNLFAKQTEDIQDKLMVTRREKGVRKDKLGVWDTNYCV